MANQVLADVAKSRSSEKDVVAEYMMRNERRLHAKNSLAKGVGDCFESKVDR